MDVLMDIELRSECIAEAIADMNARIESVLDGYDDAVLAEEARQPIAEMSDAERAWSPAWICKVIAQRILARRHDAACAKDCAGPYCTFHRMPISSCAQFHGPSEG